MAGNEGPLLTIEIAEQFLADEQCAVLNSFSAIDDAAAASLAKYEGFDLYLNGLEILSDAAASSLAKYEGNLELGGLTSLSDPAAASLAKHQGSLFLSGLTSLSDAAAASLAKHQGSLFLSGLTSLSDAAAASLATHQGSLILSGLTSLSDAAAASLAKHEGALELDGLTALSDEAAQSLSQHKGSVSLLGLASLSNAAADALRRLIHPVVDGAGVPLSCVKLSFSPLPQVSAIQSLISDIEQVAYMCGCSHNDEAAWELKFALLKFAYRYEAGQNGGRISGEIADAIKAGTQSHGVSKEKLLEILDWDVEFDDEARDILEAIPDDDEDDE